MNTRIERMKKSIVFSSLSVVALLLFLTSDVNATVLDNRIGALSVATSSLTVDVPALLKNLKVQSHLNRGPIVGGAIQATTSGSTINWPISYVSSTFTASGLQVDLVVPSSFSIVSVTAGSAANAASKTVASNGNRILLFGLNQNVIGSGVLAIVQLKLGTLAKGFYSIGLINPSATDASGNPLLLSTLSGTVEVR